MWGSGDSSDEFPIVRRGFDRERVRAAIARLEQERAELQQRVAAREEELVALRAELAEARHAAEAVRRELEGALADPDRAAQLVGREAAEVLRSATEAAAALRRRAEAQASATLERAEREAARINDEARHAAEAALAEARQAAESYLDQVRAQAAELTRMADRTAQGTVEAAKQEGRSLVQRASEHARKLIADAEAKVAERRNELAELELARLSLRQLIEQVRVQASELLTQLDAAQRYARSREAHRSQGSSEVTAARSGSARADVETSRRSAATSPGEERTGVADATSRAQLGEVPELEGALAKLEQSNLDLGEVTSLIKLIAGEADDEQGSASVEQVEADPTAAGAGAEVDRIVVEATPASTPGTEGAALPQALVSEPEHSAEQAQGDGEVVQAGGTPAYDAEVLALEPASNGGASVDATEGTALAEAPRVEEPGGEAGVDEAEASAELAGEDRTKERLARLESLFAKLAAGADPAPDDADPAAGAIAAGVSDEPSDASPTDEPAEASSAAWAQHQAASEPALEHDEQGSADDSGSLRAGDPVELADDEVESGTCPPSLYRRYLELAEPRRVDLARRTKRVVNDVVNEVLTDLREEGGVVVVERLSKLRSSPSALRTSLELHIQRNVAAGVEFAEALLGTVVAAQEVEAGLTAAELDRYLAHLDAEVLAALERTLREGDDTEELARHVGALHRELRAGRLDELAHDAATSAFFAGVRAVGEPAGYRWLLVPTDRACPDCEDNALADVVAPHEVFPTGHERPPAHPGCKCLLVPVVP